MTRSLVCLALLTPIAMAEEADSLGPVQGDSTLTAPPGVTYHLAGDAKTNRILSPTAIAFDEAGALYVAETHRFRFGVEDNREHLYWYLDDIASQTNADRLAMHEKWKGKKSIKEMTEKSEEIRKLEDLDHDGVYEKAGTYADKFNDVLDGTAAGVMAYEGTVYFACIPKVWALRDTKGTGTADVRDVIQDGFGVRVSFSGHDMNGFALGPDGRIYGTVGDRGFHVETKEGRKYPSPDRGAIFRFDPDGSNFEVIHTGLRNPKEIAFDERGNPISVDNNSDQGDKARVVYIVEGADSGWTMEHQALHSFHRQIGLENHPDNRWMVEKMWEPQNDAQPAYIIPPVANLTNGPSGLAYYPGTGYLQSEEGRFLICDYKASAPTSGIWSFKVEPSGAGMKMTNARKAVWGVTATDVEYSWDGKLYVADFKGGWTAHDDGRVLYLDAGKDTAKAKEAGETAKLIKEGFDQRSSADLAALLHHPDMRVRLRAQYALSRKPDALAQFKKATASSDQIERLHGVWGLGILARLGGGALHPTGKAPAPNAELRKAASTELAALLKHADPEVKAQAVKALEEGSLDGTKLPLGDLVVDASPRVRMFAAIAAGKLHATQVIQQVLKLLEENADKDPYLRHAGAYALQLLAKNPAELAALKSNASPHVRLAAVVALRRMKDPAVAAFLKDADQAVVEEAIRAIHDEGIEPARPAVAALLDDATLAERKPFMQRRLIHSAFRVGGVENAKRLLTVASTPALPEAVRREALRLISVWPEPPLVDQSLGRIAPLPKRNLDEIRPLLSSSMPALMKVEDTLDDAFDLVLKFKFSVEGLDDAALRAITLKDGIPGTARAGALALYAARKPADLSEHLAKLMGQGNDSLALEAMKLLVAQFPKEAVKPLLAATIAKSGPRAQAAWKNLAGVQDPEVAKAIIDQIGTLRQNGGVSPSALELLAAARGRSEPEVKKTLADYEAELKAKEATDPLAPWMASLEGGNAGRGASLFQSHPVAECLRCHRAEVNGDHGGEAGPNLAGVASRGDRMYLLQSLIVPSAKVVAGYGIVSMTFANGESFGGTLLAETPDYVDIDANGKRWRVNRKDIRELTPAVSAMPPMNLLMKPDEIRDIVAWLATLQKGEKPAKPLPAPPVLDPATLKH
ncbi:HEAT repeat domain-containing protein [Luteolibacter ambystomatis]|uniref:HEAT repeat domain-containing protein n=1 Tax=Luteolibacter ambystomatis TaxID=2824561 RepID=A0A975PFK9_9BACT|nr:HEAT repeat domain-containing protein [Luteolibacter ambystomatis]QUE52088.1 HEAT repeat domain-containing protein [Luteolibacter ambystomatis]